MKNLEIAVCKMITRDNYKEGCDPSSAKDLGQIALYSNQGVEDVANIIKFFTGDRNTPTVFDDRIEVNVMENAEGFEPTKEEVALFEKGEVRLWIADYSFYVSKKIPLNQDDLLEAFDYELS